MKQLVWPQRIEGAAVDLVLERINPADPKKGYVPSADYAIVPHGGSGKIGGICLRVGDNENTFYGGHVGYGVEPEYRGRGYAAAACRLLAPLARAAGMDAITITTNPDNYPSRRVCEKLGAELLEIVDLPPTSEMYQEGERQKCRYRWMLLEQ